MGVLHLPLAQVLCLCPRFKGEDPSGSTAGLPPFPLLLYVAPPPLLPDFESFESQLSVSSSGVAPHTASLLGATLHVPPCLLMATPQLVPRLPGQML
jgi:hypothetical protein